MSAPSAFLSFPCLVVWIRYSHIRKHVPISPNRGFPASIPFMCGKADRSCSGSPFAWFVDGLPFTRHVACHARYVEDLYWLLPVPVLTVLSTGEQKYDAERW